MNIIFENKKYGYEDYQKFVEKLTSEYVDPKSIAVVLKRTPQLLFLLYYFKNGLTYIPIDYFYPNERIQYILEDSKPVSIILDSTKNLSYNPKHKNDSSGIAFNDTISYILYTSGSTGTPKGVMITLEGLNNFIDGISEIIANINNLAAYFFKHYGITKRTYCSFS